ncbi:mug158, partial [Symbiodinium necroappetens]
MAWARASKKEKNSQKMSSKARAAIKAAAARAKTWLSSRDKRCERGAYFVAARRGFGGCKRLCVSLDASRGGGRKRSHFAMLDLESGVACWGQCWERVSVRAISLGLQLETHADSEYRQAGTHAAPVEAGLFEQATVQFLRMQRQRETEETEKQKKVKNPLLQVSKQRLPTYAALLSLDHVMLSRVEEEADEYLSLTDFSPSSTSCTTLIRHLLPRIRAEKNWETSADVQDVRAALASASFLRRKGTTNSSRWDSFHESFRSRKGEWGLLLLVLLSYGLRLGYILNPKQATLSEDISQVLPKAEEAASGQAEVAEKSLKQAKQKKDALYQRCRNKLHCCTVLLGSMEFCRDMTVWYLATEALSAELNHVRKNVHGRNATRELMVGLACGTSPKVGLDVIAELLQVPHNAEGLRQLHVLLQDDVVGAVNVKQIAREVQHPWVMWQDSIVQQLTDTVLCACRFKLMNLSQHMFCFPLRFAALISEKQEDVNRCLKECVALSESWDAARHAATDSKAWNAVCSRSPMQTVVTREIFEALKASNFASVPPDVHRFLHDVMGMFSSTYNEEAFGEMRGLESRENKCHAMPNADIWQSASHSGVLRRFGYREVAVDDSQEDPRLPESLYHTKGLEPTMENLKHAMLPSELMMTKDLYTRKLLDQ